MDSTATTTAAAALAAFTDARDSHRELARAQAARGTAFDSFHGVAHMVVPETLNMANVPALVAHSEESEYGLDPRTMRLGVAVVSAGTRLELTGDLDLSDTFTEAAALDLFTRAFDLYETTLRTAANAGFTLAG